ncbi:MAG: hypothetical protein I3273_02920 [Candidatus Moeniiplasma glomeromycotorum]|nr:hypothetical protein [Candidatus Moeniiplasma glomeromycotorum]MCE8167592.1 hypothetical protein [Candidatus Moeniiplasma glomeromycotorum]MCE8169058.1 hypothetical protein [Candidatus Moeniiplasma glomeromycotorum]
MNNNHYKNYRLIVEGRKVVSGTTSKIPLNTLTQNLKIDNLGKDFCFFN